MDKLKPLILCVCSMWIGSLLYGSLSGSWETAFASAYFSAAGAALYHFIFSRKENGLT